MLGRENESQGFRLLSFRASLIGEESASYGETADSSRDTAALRNDNSPEYVRNALRRQLHRHRYTLHDLADGLLGLFGFLQSGRILTIGYYAVGKYWNR